jgi:hypothetical protein
MPSLAELLARDCVVQMESTIPAELTIAEWRRGQARQRVDTRRGPRRRLARGRGR